ncbi:hypothetical protein GGI04_002877 [Coemansia thaxteri]|nr:hypothetical protein GGI04_002877 [Coemansia thaxteri]
MANPLHLYRSILRVHRFIPREMRFVGDQYVRSEFRSHRTVGDKRYLEPFFAQWTAYLHALQAQTAEADARCNVNGSPHSSIGAHLDPSIADMLEDDKAEQLLELHRASARLDTPEHEAVETPNSARSPKRP